MNLLFTSAGRRVELLRAFRNAYAELGIEGRIVTTDIDPLAPALAQADRIYLVPRVTDPRFIPALADICLKERIDLIIPLVDTDIPVLVAGHAELEAAGARALVPSHEAAITTRDKFLTYRFFSDLGVPTPKSWIPSELGDADVSYPLFIKPRCGSAAEQTFTVRNPKELAFFIDYVEEPLVQEYLPGPEITNDVFCDLDGNVRSVVSRQRIEVRAGEVAKGKTVYDAEIVEYCVRVAKGLETKGPITVQCILRDGRPYFTEVNARFGGGVPLGIAAGVNSPKWLLALAAGCRVDTPPLGTYETGLYLTRFDESILRSESDRARIESNRLRP
jgi:carbamoyl-phosphate synthase large subunit